MNELAGGALWPLSKGLYCQHEKALRVTICSRCPKFTAAVVD
jgi:hypothetical protein